MNMLMTNINPKTGIAYGLISSNALHPDVVDALMYGSQAKDLSYEAWLAGGAKIELRPVQGQMQHPVQNAAQIEKGMNNEPQ